MADLAGAVVAARQTCERLASQRLVKGGTGKEAGRVTMLVQVVEHHGGEGGADLVGRADAALYGAKRAGRNRVCAADARSAED